MITIFSAFYTITSPESRTLVAIMIRKLYELNATSWGVGSLIHARMTETTNCPGVMKRAGQVSELKRILILRLEFEGHSNEKVTSSVPMMFERS